MKETDQKLVERIRRGDARAFETLYYRYRDWVVSLAHRFCGNREDALDVLQETFAYVHRKFPAFELRCQMKTFLYPAVKHLALSRKQAARRHAPLETDIAQTPVARTTEEVDHLVAQLPEERRETVWLRFVDGLDLKEIAEAMEVPLGTVKSRLHNALKALRARKISAGDEPSKGPDS
ncbi:MAG: RNA polymerase sigma factor [Planctomycetota bacterium]